MEIRAWTPNAEDRSYKVFLNYKLFGVYTRPVIDILVKGMNEKVADVSFNNEYAFITTESGSLEK